MLLGDSPPRAGHYVGHWLRRHQCPHEPQLSALFTLFVRHLSPPFCANPARFADRVEFAFVDDAGKLLPDDAPNTVANLTLDWIQRTD